MKPSRRYLSLSLAGLGVAAVLVAAYAFFQLSDTTLTREDKVEATRQMVAWALDGTALPGWDETNPWLDEIRKARDVAVVYRIYSKEPGFDNLLSERKADRDRNPITFKDSRVRVLEVEVEGGSIGGQAEVVLWLEGDGRSEGFHPTMTIWTPSMKGESRVVCRWDKRFGRLVAEPTLEVFIPSQGWEPVGKKPRS